MPSTSFSIIVPTTGRPTLERTLRSITSQMQPGDELLVDYNNEGDWGNSARTRMMRKATGTHLLFMDDDDAYLPGAFIFIRAAIASDPTLPHMFRMKYADDRVLFKNPVIEVDNVSTQMFITPNVQSRLPDWGTEYAADFEFIEQTCINLRHTPIWHPEIIAVIDPTTP